jgi:hypothetical protein
MPRGKVLYRISRGRPGVELFYMVNFKQTGQMYDRVVVKELVCLRYYTYLGIL